MEGVGSEESFFAYSEINDGLGESFNSLTKWVEYSMLVMIIAGRLEIWP